MSTTFFRKYRLYTASHSYIKSVFFYYYLAIFILLFCCVFTFLFNILYRSNI